MAWKASAAACTSPSTWRQTVSTVDPCRAGIVLNAASTDVESVAASRSSNSPSARPISLPASKNWCRCRWMSPVDAVTAILAVGPVEPADAPEHQPPIIARTARFVARFFACGLLSSRSRTGRGHRHLARPRLEVDPRGHDSRPPAPATVGRGEDPRAGQARAGPPAPDPDPRRAEDTEAYRLRPGQFGKTLLVYPVRPTATIRDIPWYPSADSLVCCLSCASYPND